MSKEYKIAQDQLWSSKVANYTKEFPDIGKTLNRSPTKRKTDFVFRNDPEVTGFQRKSKALQCTHMISVDANPSWLSSVLYIRLEWQQMAIGFPPPLHFPNTPRYSSGFQKHQIIDHWSSFVQGMLILNFCLLTKKMPAYLCYDPQMVLSILIQVKC